MISHRQTRKIVHAKRHSAGGAILSVVMAMAALFSLVAPTPSRAEPRCMARILADVPAEEAPEQIMSKSNGEFGPVTQIKVKKDTGRMLYCAGKSYCYNSNAFEFISPCRLKIDKEGGFGNYFWYFTR